MKSQGVRALDVFVIGPAMIAGGSTIYKHSYDDGTRRALGALLIFAGVATVIYNGNNWLKGEAARDAAAAAPTPTPPAAPATTPPAATAAAVVRT